MFKILHFISKNKLLFFSLLFALSFIYIIHDDYIAADAYIIPSDSYTYITNDNPVEISIQPTMSIKKLNSILFSIANPTTLTSDYETTIDLYGDNNIISSISFSNDTCYEITDSLGNATELFFDTIAPICSYSDYKFKISSSAPTVENAYGFRLNNEGTIWNRLTYVLLTKDQQKLVYTLIFIVLISFMYVILYILNRNFTTPEKIFLFLSLVLCPFYLFIVPVFQTPDEVNHFVRAYTIAHGYFLSPSGGNVPIPQNLVPYEWYTYTPFILFQNFHMTIDSFNAILHNNVNMALYSPVSYIFQVIGIRIADIFSDNTYILVLAGSLANITGCTVLIYYAIKWIPSGKELLTFISLLPMALQLRCSLSVDAITYAILVLFLAFCLCKRCQNSLLNKKDIIILFTLVFILSSCKIVYFVAILFIFLLPSPCFQSTKKEVLLKAFGCFEALLLSVGWFFIANSYLGS